MYHVDRKSSYLLQFEVIYGKKETKSLVIL